MGDDLVPLVAAAAAVERHPDAVRRWGNAGRLRLYRVAGVPGVCVSLEEVRRVSRGRRAAKGHDPQRPLEPEQRHQG